MSFAPNSLLALAGLAIVAAPAQGACWSPATYQAAQVRELDTLLTVGAMRCMSGPPVMADAYNRFVRTNGAALDSAGVTLRRHLATQFGDAEANGAYRRFVSAGADRHLAGAALLSCEELAAVARSATASGPDGLARFAQSAGLRPKAESMLCRESGPAVLVAARR